MIQQTANLFSEGMNLDTHPIAINNLLLASALNATMVTMNGNELVLLNDMGNGRVESAYLPAGYVPVGMTEFGGIIYVASHNPLTGLSQIGSFPSPERNISSDEISNGANKVFLSFSNLSLKGLYPFLNENELYIPSLALKLGIKVDSPIRPGDKFSIEMENDEEFITLLKLLKINALNLYPCTINSDGAFVKIEDLIEDYDYWIRGNTVSNQDNGGQKYSSFVFCRDIGNERRYNVYKNKIVGDLYLKLDLGVPDNIPYYILANTDNGTSEYTILMPKLPNISKYRVHITTTNNKEYWIDTDLTSIDNLFIIGTKEGTSEEVIYFYGSTTATDFYTITYQFTDSTHKGVIHNYTIVPYFKPGSNLKELINIDLLALDKNSGYLVSMTTKGSIDLDKLGKGIINFNLFRYYNNTTDGIFTLSYSMETYLKSSQFINLVDLCTVDYNKLLDSNGNLSTTSILIQEGDGLYSTVIGSSKVSYFGNFLQSIPYNDDGLKIGKVYIAFLRARILTTISENFTYKYSKPFLLFTSSISNYLFSSNMELYIDAATGNNSVDINGNPKKADETANVLWDDYIGVPCNINWKYSINDRTKIDTYTSGYTVPYESSSDDVYYKQIKSGDIQYTLNPVVELRFGNDFPLDTSKVSADFDYESVVVDPDETTYSYEAELVGTHTSEGMDNMLMSPVVDLDCNKSLDYRVTYDANSRTLTCGVRAVAEFKGSTIGVQDEDVVGNAYIPLLDPSIIDRVLMLNLYTDSNSNETQGDGDLNLDPVYYELSRWFSYYSYDGDRGSHSRKTSYIVDTTLDTVDASYPGYSTNVNEYILDHDSDGVEDLFTIKKNDASWIKFSVPYREKYQERYEEAPLITFNLPTSSGRTQFNVSSGKDACVPMLLDISGVYRPIEDIGYATSYSGHIGYVSNLVSRYENNGFIMQENLIYTISYRYANKNDIIYSKPYLVIYNVKVRGSLIASLGELFPTDAIISTAYETDDNITKVTISVFTNTNETHYKDLNKALSNPNTFSVTNAVKLPKMALIDKQNNVKIFDESIIPIAVSSPDIELLVAIFLSSNHSEQNTPAIVYGELIGTTDCLGKALSPNMMYFADNNRVLYSSDTLSKLSKSGNKYIGTVDGLEIVFEHLYADCYVNLSKAISNLVIKVTLDKSYNSLRGLYISFGTAKVKNYIADSNDSGRYDKIGWDDISLGANYQGIKIALVGKANAYTPYSDW